MLGGCQCGVIHVSHVLQFCISVQTWNIGVAVMFVFDSRRFYTVWVRDSGAGISLGGFARQWMSGDMCSVPASAKIV